MNAAANKQASVSKKEKSTIDNSKLPKPTANPKFTLPTVDEINRSLNQIESSFIYSMQSVGGFGGKSDQLNSYATFTGKPDYFLTDLERYRKVTPADVQRVANTYLIDKHLVMSFVPRPKDKEMPKMNAAANQQTSVSKKEKAKIDSSKLPKPTANPRFTFPNVEKTKLSNGLEVWLVKQAELPLERLLNQYTG